MQSHHHREVRERDSPKTRGKTTLVSSLPLPLSFHVCARAHMFSFLCVPPCASSLHTCRYCCCCCCFRSFFPSSVFMLCFSFCGFSLTHSHILTHTRIFQKETSFLLRRCFFFVCFFFYYYYYFLLDFIPLFFFPPPFFFIFVILRRRLKNNASKQPLKINKKKIKIDGVVMGALQLTGSIN